MAECNAMVESEDGWSIRAVIGVGAGINAAGAVGAWSGNSAEENQTLIGVIDVALSVGIAT